MKKIGIITIQKCDNFGADLQAYALGAKLRSMGYDAENIDYLFYKHPRHIGGRDERSVFKPTLVNHIKELLFPIVARIKGLRYRATRELRRQRFDAWFNANVKCGKEYRSVSSLYADPPRYDVYVVGSDQVWNPRMYSNLKPYFLDFAPQGAKCISYASSFGVSELPAGVFYQYKQWLKRFDAIASREESGAEIVKMMSLNAEVKQVVDPTLLLTSEEWLQVAIKPDEPHTQYVLLYDLIANEETVALANRWGEVLHLPVVRIANGAYGPGEFLWLFAHAAAIVTNSFHGTAFSILNHKPFFSVIPQRMKNAGRIESLVRSLGLENRLISARHCKTVNLAAAIDFALIQVKIESLRADSCDYLMRAVEGRQKFAKPQLPLGCYAVWNMDERVRAESTSGGLFRVLAETTIAKGGVAYGAAFTKDFHHVEHCAAETIEALDPLMKSKYVWSNPINAYRQVVENLKNGREVLFAGTPCQIVAIKNLAKGFGEKLVTVDIVCHGTPRPEVFAAYVSELEVRFGSKVKKYEFRNKDAGWNFPHVNCEFSAGGVYNMILRNDPYCLGYGLNVNLRSACFRCPFVGLERKADFTIADCWRVATSHPQWDDEKGTSLVLVNTLKAQTIWKDILLSGKIRGDEYDLDLAQMRNRPLRQHEKKPEQYEPFNKIFDESGSFAKASCVFLTHKTRLCAILVYYVKKLGWAYFRRHQ